tara:strand:+ start:421 stop:618 length:198 start_codon:yes stop_codon:yes gene_type:complete
MRNKVILFLILISISSCGSWRSQWKSKKKELNNPTNAIACWEIKGKCWNYDKMKCVKCSNKEYVL